MLRANEVKRLKNNLLNSFKRNDIGVDTFVSLRDKLNNEQLLCNLCIFDMSPKFSFNPKRNKVGVTEGGLYDIGIEV